MGRRSHSGFVDSSSRTNGCSLAMKSWSSIFRCVFAELISPRATLEIPVSRWVGYEKRSAPSPTPTASNVLATATTTTALERLNHRHAPGVAVAHGELVRASLLPDSHLTAGVASLVIVGHALFP